MALTKVGKEGITGISNSSDANAITIDSSEKVGIGDTSPLGNKVHIRTAGSATSVNGDAGLVLESDDSTRCDLQFMGPDGAFQSIYFGDVSDDNRGIIAYSHSGNNMRFTVDASERMRLTSDGLTFNGDTAAANALDDYEEGTFTPVIAASGSAPTVGYSNQTGAYVKIGNMVTVFVRITLSSISGGSGTAKVGALPFTSENRNHNRGNAHVMLDQLSSDNRTPSIQNDLGGTTMTILKDTGTTSSHAGLDISEFTASTDVRFQYSYTV